MQNALALDKRVARVLRIALVAICATAWGTRADANVIYQLNASNIVIDNPSPLFSTSQVGGTFTLDSSVVPGGAFGVSQIAGFAFNFGGVAVTLPQTQLPGGDLTAFGNVSADGSFIAFLDLRFDLPSTVVPCSLICAGQVQIGTFDQSNFVAIDDLNADTTSLLVFDASLTKVPEPLTFSLFGAGLIGAAALRRRKTSKGGTSGAV